MLLIRNLLNWSIRIILLGMLLWGILPYLPKNYQDNDMPDNNFPILIVNSGNKPEILRFKDWTKISPKPVLFSDIRNGKALMGNMIFTYNAALSQYKSNSDNLVVTLKRDDPDHIVSAEYIVKNNRLQPIRYHSIDPGIAFVFILWLAAWGVSAVIRRIIFQVLNRFTKIYPRSFGK